MAGVFQGLSCFADAFYAQFIGYLLIVFLFGEEEPELGFLSGQLRRKGVLYNGGKGGIGHDKASFPSSQELVGEQAEGIGVSFEMSQIVPFHR